MARQVSKGRCSFCDAIFGKVAITAHLKSCEQRKTISDALTRKPRKSQKTTKSFHLVVEGRYLRDYWMHLNVSADATLKDLDDFLRDTWLECCGHLSAFTIGDTSYERDTDGVDAMWPMIFGRPRPVRSMGARLGSVLHPGLKFYHEYDFGTPTHLKLEVISEEDRRYGGVPIQLLARNEPPLIACDECGKTATQVCSQCIWDDKGWLCDKCARRHKCGEEMLLPIVNSPRVGMCGYTGE